MTEAPARALDRPARPVPATARAGVAAVPVVAWVWRHRGGALARSLVLVAVLRVLLGAVAAAAVRWLPQNPALDDWRELRRPASSLAGLLVGPWQRWDGLWYQHLAQSGYRADHADAAFFPLYPGTVHVTGWLLADEGVAALTVSTVSLVVALVLLDRLVRADIDAGAGQRSVVLLALLPTAFFLLGPFSEALSLALTLATVLAARRRRLTTACLLGALTALSRPTGAFVAVPVAVELLVRLRTGRDRPRLRDWVAPLGPAAGLVAWWGVASTVLHRSPFEAASAWGQHVTPPWTSLTDSAHAIADAAHPEEIVNLAAVALLVVSIPLMWRRVPWSYVAYAAAMAPVLSFREAYLSPLMSAGRYLLVVFPVAVALAVRLRRPAAFAAVAVLEALCLVVLFTYWACGNFVG